MTIKPLPPRFTVEYKPGQTVVLVNAENRVMLFTTQNSGGKLVTQHTAHVYDTEAQAKADIAVKGYTL